MQGCDWLRRLRLHSIPGERSGNLDIEYSIDVEDCEAAQVQWKPFAHFGRGRRIGIPESSMIKERRSLGCVGSNGT